MFMAVRTHGKIPGGRNDGIESRSPSLAGDRSLPARIVQFVAAESDAILCGIHHSSCHCSANPEFDLIFGCPVIAQSQAG